jgi:hypothetical protein
MRTLYTFWPTPSFSGTADASAPANFPSLAATFTSPDMLTKPGDTNGGTTLKTPDAVTAERAANLSLFACVLDPFTAMHVYSDLLPIAELKLPPWTVEKALGRMTAFFKVGPVLLTNDVPVLKGDDLAKHVLKPEDPPGNVLPGFQVALPTVGKAEWAWLQPYPPPDDARSVRDDGGKIQVKPPPYVALEVGRRMDGRGLKRGLIPP